MIQGLNIAISIVGVLCYLYVIYQMFDKAESVMGIVCLVGVCLFGLGGLVAFVYGWIKAREWEIVPVMAIWSGCIAANLLLAGLNILLGG
jgi:hypothetical protein